MPSSKVLLTCVVLLLASTYAQDLHAIVYLQPTSNSPYSISGSVTFIQQGTGIVTITADIDGLPDGDYAMHVHQYGDLTDTFSGLSAGAHFTGSQVNATHGCPDISQVRHEGDMGSWTSVSGNILEQKQLDLLQLSGADSIIGRAVVLHELADSCSGESGNAGKRYAFGVIGIHNRHDSQASQAFDAPLLVCNLEGTVNCPDCHGTVWFQAQNDSSTIQVTGEIFGLALDTVHAIHVHQYGDLTKADGTSLGGHWNPEGNVHGLPEADSPHAGDMGNVQNYDIDGTAWYKYKNNLIGFTGNITGRGVVLHELPDHGRGYACDPATGNAGTRLAVCVIGIASNNTVVPDVPIRIKNDWVDIDCEEPIVVTTDQTTILSFGTHFTTGLYVFTSTNASPVLSASVVVISLALMLLM